MCKNKKAYSVAIIIVFIAMLSVAFFAFSVFSHSGTNNITTIQELNDYTPIALTDSHIAYYFVGNSTMVTGIYDIDMKHKNDAGDIDNFYISYGIPALTNNIVYLPITLSNGEHNLLSMDLENNTVENISTAYNSEPLTSISTMSDKIYTLNWNFDGDGIYSSYIEMYNDITKEMDICILKESINKNNGEIIKSFACNDGKIYAIIEKKDGNSKNVYVNVYDGEKYSLLNTLSFNDEFESLIVPNDIAQFYSFGDYVYIRNFSDYGIIGKVNTNGIEPILILPQLRIAHNSKNTKDEYYVFFIRESNEYYILDIEDESLFVGNLQLQDNESFRNAISDGNNLCVSILDDSIVDLFVTKHTQIYSYEDLLKLSKHFKTE